MIVEESYTSRKVFWALNSMFVTLILDKDELTSVEDFRPISLYVTSFIILSEK